MKTSDIQHWEYDDELRDCPWCGLFTRAKIINKEICCGSCDRPIDKAQSKGK
tara:strand:+ start:279 stop:434 length:156 start_codon:yes stop_codon:yes gene_type:complete